MEIAAVIVNFNDSVRACQLAKTLSDFRIFQEIVLVDNGSMREEREKIVPIEGVTFLFREKNGGFGVGNNAGLRHLRKNPPRVVLTINPDIVPDRQSCLDCYRFLLDHEEIAACSTLMTQKGKVTRNYYDIPTFASTMAGDHNFSSKIRSRKDYEGYFTCGFVRESFCFFRYDLFEKIGFFDENIFLYNEGASTALRFERMGYREAIGLNGRSVEHRHRGRLITHKGFRLLKQSRSYFLRVYRNEPEWKIRLFNLWWVNVLP